VVGVRLSGSLRGKAAATDAALALTELLRGVGVVGRFVEFFGPGIESLSVPDRATIANMAPEYGATCGFFPVDELTVEYLALTGRQNELCDRVRLYSKSQDMFWEAESPVPDYSQVVEFDLGDVRPSLAGPRRPQQRVEVGSLRDNFRSNLAALAGGQSGKRGAESHSVAAAPGIEDGSVVIAAITSCTNTSNPALMMAAGIVARKAVEAGLRPPQWVKTSLTPGSRVVTGYLDRAGLLTPLEQLGFDVAGYGCATCIGNSGPLDPAVAGTIERENLVVAAVLSGNRNFEARIHPMVRANYLASPALVVAYALAGTVDIDLDGEPLGPTPDGRSIYLDDLWPTPDELQAVVNLALEPELFTAGHEDGVKGTDSWRSLEVPRGSLFEWDEGSTYVRQPPFLEGFTAEPAPPKDVVGARILALLGDSITTDHISPAGAIGADTPAGRYLLDHGVAPGDFNTYGSRRGNHEVLLRGTFANVRLRNRMADGREGGWTKHHPSDELLPIYEAAVRYAAEEVPLVVFAGKEYGTGSSRDWAAKGTALLGVRAVVAESFERIHRSNLIGMGVLPVELPRGTSLEGLKLDGSEIVDVRGVTQLAPGGEVQVAIRRADGSQLSLCCRARLDSAAEITCFLHGGVLPWVLRGKMEAPCS
jgi:aconitate hydratase